MKQGYRGYVSSRGFGGYVIPVPVQSLALRDYCSRKGKIYVLPVNENSFPHSYMVLEGIIAELAAFEGIVMCSIHMLPQRPQRRKDIYSKVLDQSCSLHFVIEGLQIASHEQIQRVEDLLVFSRLAHEAIKPQVLREP
jgi:sporadic carbohydrate cluster protein (TIGR04323 family)